MAVKKQKSVDTQESKPVKTTLVLDVELYSKLCAKAALRRTGISALAVEFIRAGLRGVVVFDRVDGSVSVKPNDRLGVVSDINPSEENAA